MSVELARLKRLMLFRVVMVTTLLSIDTYSVGGSAQVGSKSIIARFVTRLRYVRLVLTTGGSGPNFGAASAAISLDAPQYLPIGGAVTSPL